MARSDRWNEIGLRSRIATLTVRTALVLFLALAGGACREEGPAERAGEEIDEALDDAGEAVDEAVDDVQEKVDDDDEE
jgi:hypothetical protein